MEMSPQHAYRYAANVVQGRWEEGEEIIRTDPEYSFYYALNFVEGRWEDGEASIKTSAEFSYKYALFVLKRRWEEGEAAIIRSPEFCYKYAKDVIGGPLPEPMHVAMYMADSNNKWVKKYVGAKKYKMKIRHEKDDVQGT